MLLRLAHPSFHSFPNNKNLRHLERKTLGFFQGSHFFNEKEDKEVFFPIEQLSSIQLNDVVHYMWYVIFIVLGYNLDSLVSIMYVITERSARFHFYSVSWKGKESTERNNENLRAWEVIRTLVGSPKFTWKVVSLLITRFDCHVFLKKKHTRKNKNKNKKVFANFRVSYFILSTKNYMMWRLSLFTNTFNIWKCFINFDDDILCS